VKKEAPQRWKRVGENLVRYVPSGTIYAVFRVRGRKAPVRLSLGTKDLRTAKGKLPEKRREAEQMDTAPDRTIFVAELVERYKETLGGLSPSSIRDRSARADAIAKDLGRLLVADVKPSDFETWLAHQSQRGLSKATYNEYLRVVRHLFEYAQRDGIIEVSPVAHLKQKKRDTPIRATPTDKEFELILEDIRSNEANQLAQESADFLEFMALAGVGNSETAALCWKHVDFEHGQLTLFRKKTCSGYAIPMFPLLRSFLEQKLGKEKQMPENRVFGIDNPRKALTNACKRLQLTHYTNRSFRRYFITRAIRKGVDVKTISKWQNHKDGGMLVLSTYSHVIADHEKAMADKLA